MDQQFDFRALLLKLQDCLSDNDRRRLHFIVGDTIPRQLRDDPTLGGTLSLLESLFDRAKISEQDFDYLIHAFNEIHCYDAVKRLKEHQLCQHLRDRSGTTSTNVSELFDDNEEDKINYIKIRPDMIPLSTPEIRQSTSTQSTTIVLEQPTINNDKLTLTKSSSQNKSKILKLDLTVIKQLLKSRITICQLMLLLLNIIGIIVFIILIVVFTKSKNTSTLSDIILVKTGTFYGNPAGGNPFDDAQNCSLTFKDKIVRVIAGWTSDALDYVTFVYSNGGSAQHGRDVYRDSPYTSEFNLGSDENINGVTVFTGTRVIPNPYSPNGSYFVVGLTFYTNKGRITQVFGSSNGTQVNELIPAFSLAYTRGRSQGYLDGIQFTWYKQVSPLSIVNVTMY